MAVDIQQVCAVAAEHQSSQDLAIWLSVLFSIYTVVAIALSALTIYTSSQMGSLDKDPRPCKTGSNSVVVASVGAAPIDAVSLVGLR